MVSVTANAFTGASIIMEPPGPMRLALLAPIHGRMSGFPTASGPTSRLSPAVVLRFLTQIPESEDT